MESEITQYASYNSLGRKALILGIPVLVLISMLILILVTGFFGIKILGLMKGIIAPIVLLGLLFIIRIKCMDDSRALESVIWEIKGALARVKCRSSIISYTSNDQSIKNKKAIINEFYKLNNIK